MLRESFFTVEKQKTHKEIIFLFIGILMFSFYAGILLPYNNLATGGALGLALVLNKFIGINIGTAQLLLNIPLFYIALRYLGKKFTIITFIVIGCSSLFINILPNIITPINLGDKLVAAIFAGIISGISLSCILISGGSTGGSDITGKYISKKV